MDAEIDFDIYDIDTVHSESNRKDENCRCDQFISDIAIIEDKYEDVLKQVNEVKAELKLANRKNQVYERENKILKANISSLYKTAKAEIDRKRDQITELRRELDDLILRRIQQRT